MTLITASPTFLGARSSSEPSKIDTAFTFLGIPFGPAYEASELSAFATAPNVVRQATADRSFTRMMSHWDFNIGGPLFENNVPDLSDVGNFDCSIYNLERLNEVTQSVIVPILKSRSVPIVVGGQDSIPPLVIGAFENHEDINVLQIDAHLDFREEIYGRRDGRSNTMRRVRDFECVKDVVHFGTRSIGTARRSEVESALALGNKIITAWQIHDEGVKSFLPTFDQTRRWVVTIDCDGLDPSIAPAVASLEPGGLTFHQATTVLRHLARNNQIAGLIFTEFQPEKDPAGTTALTIVRLILDVIGHQRGGYQG